MSDRLDAYLTLERVMLSLDESGDDLGDTIRDQMDALWYALTDKEHAFLNARTIGMTGSGPIQCPLPLPQPWLSRPPKARTLIRDQKVGLQVPAPSEQAA